MRTRLFLTLGLVLGVAVLAIVILRPSSSQSSLAASARAEGELVIYANADEDAVAPLLAAFARAHPEIAIDYRDLPSAELHNRFEAEARKGKPIADIVWSSAMDAQAKLINDGHALAYASPEKAALPDNAVWKDRGYRITAEPVAIAFNTDLIAPARAPRTHLALTAMLRDERDALAGKVATYDPALSDIGYLYLTQDFAITRDTRALMEAIAATGPELATSSVAMIDAVARGDLALAYNVVGPYAAERAREDDRLGVIYPEDYTIVASRVAFIARDARHPAAAKLFLDYLLSSEGQTLLADAGLPPVRSDVASETLSAPQARPIPGGPRLFVNLDPVKRRRFLAQWDEILANGEPTR